MTSFAWKTATAASERGGRRLWPSLLVLTAGIACSGARAPDPLPPQTVTPTPPSAVAAEPEPAPAAATPRPPRPTATRVVTIEPVEPEPDDEPTLVEAARRERERRRQAGAPMVVIDDKNLQQHATGLLTFAEEEPEPDATDPDSAEPDSADPDSADADSADPDSADAESADRDSADRGATGDPPAEDGRDESYWRERVSDLRVLWREAWDRVPQLEERVAELRRRFYEADDAYYRDTRIKPAWDRAIDQIAQARAEAEAHRLELAEVLDEGRRSGALPGWLREGIELEPEPLEPETEGHEPGEPEIFEIDDGARP